MMNSRNKLNYNIVRILLGLILLPNAFIAFFVQPEQMGLNPQALQILNNFWGTGYLMHVVKVIEFITAILFLTNRYVKLTTVIFVPILVNIVLLDVFIEPKALVMGLPLLLMTSYIVYCHIDRYRPMLQAK